MFFVYSSHVSVFVKLENLKNHYFWSEMVNLCNLRTKFLTEMYLMILQRTLKFLEAYKDVIFLNCRFSNSLNCESVSRFFSVIIDLTHYWILEFSKISFRSTFGWTIPSENLTEYVLPNKLFSVIKSLQCVDSWPSLLLCLIKSMSFWAPKHAWFQTWSLDICLKVE